MACRVKSPKYNASVSFQAFQTLIIPDRRIQEFQTSRSPDFPTNLGFGQSGILEPRHFGILDILDSGVIELGKSVDTSGVPGKQVVSTSKKIRNT